MIVLVAALASCASPAATGRSTPRSVPVTTPPPAGRATLPADCVTAVFDRMTRPERTGQLFMVGVPTDGPSAAARQAAVGSQAGGVLLFGGGAMSSAEVRSLVAELQDANPLAAMGVGLYVGADQEGGLVQELAGPGFSVIPAGLAQGTIPPGELEADATRWGHELAAVGVNVDLAPVADVVPAAQTRSNQADGRYSRQLGSDPPAVASHVVALVRGVQQTGVAATLKHFPGLGRVDENTDFSARATDPVTTASDPFLEPFRAGMTAGARLVMVSLARYARLDAANPAAYSSAVISGLLRGRLHYGGLVISDDLGAAAAAASLPPDRRAVAFVQAGGDIAVIVKPPSTVAPIVSGLLAAEATSSALRASVDSAVTRVLRDKERAGLLRCAP